MAYEKEIKEIEEILKCRFAVESERKRWENRLFELRIKEKTFRNNESYRNKNIKYDR